MNRSKIVAIVTGAISLIIALAYLLLVQLLDFRGEMLPAPLSQLSPPTEIKMNYPAQTKSLEGVSSALLIPGEIAGKPTPTTQNI